MRVGVLASGSGTILEALLERGLPIVVVVADRRCRALEIAAAAGIGVSSATIATLIYAIPPAIRITALGIRSVPESTVEAARSLGSTSSQILAKVQLPLARRT